MKSVLFSLLGMTLLFGSVACQSGQNTTQAEETATKETVAAKYNPPAGEEVVPVKHSEAEWKKMLTAEEYYVLREAGTERAFTGDLLENKNKGVYTCAACGLPLFASDTKFESGTGWPSFWEPVDKKYVLDKEDNQYGMSRVEVICGRCEGHLGHVFPDGPAPTGLRYCINSVSLDFVPKEQVKKP